MGTFIQKNDFVSMHEPYSETFYVEPERMSTRFSEDYCIGSKRVRSTYAETTMEIIANAERNKEKKICCKDMAHHIIRPDWQQHPENPTVLSLHECSTIVEGDIIFIPDEAEYVELRILYSLLTKLKAEPSLLLIDADDLLKNAVEIMKTYSARIGVEFQPEMLKWKAEKIETFKKWEGFHTDAEQSTGRAETVRDRSAFYPTSVYEAIKEIMPIYEELFRYRIHP